MLMIFDYHKHDGKIDAKLKQIERLLEAAEKIVQEST